MADSKSALNMGGSSTAAFVVDITGSIQDMRQSLNLAVQEVRNLNQALQTTKSLVSGIQLPSAGGGQSGGWSTNQVAPNPKFSPPSQAPVALNAPNQNRGGNAGGSYSGGGYSSGPSSNVVAAGPGGGGNDFTGNTNLSDFVSKYGGGTLFASSLASGALKSPADTVEAQLLMQRSSYFSGGRANYADINKLQTNMGYAGSQVNDMDNMRALAAAQAAGITGPNITQAGGNYGSVAMGVAAASNLVPGIGTEGTMRAFASMQQGKNVNMLRGIGIRLRDEQGNLKPPNMIIEDLWAKICRDYSGAYGAGKKPSEREVLIGLQPGNSIDSMLDQYFGNDPMAKQLIANGLLFKAKGGKEMTKEALAQLGGTTEASNTYFGTQAESGRGLGNVAAAGASGYTSAAKELLGMSKRINDNFTVALQGLTYMNAAALTYLGAGGDALKKVMEFLMIRGVLGGASGAGGGLPGLPGLIKPKASGGPVDGAMPYIVGEKGPELFVPKKDGTIIPNHELGPFRHHGGSVKAKGADMTKNSWAKSVLAGLGAKATPDNISAMMSWMASEGGHWNNSAGYNPLNTTYDMPGSSLMDAGPGRDHGVRHYNSWQQGIDATIKTLTGNKADQRGYSTIVDLLKSGAKKDEIMSAVYKSSWGTGKGSGSSFGSSDFWTNLLGPDAAKQLEEMNKAFSGFNSAFANTSSSGGGWGALGSSVSVAGAGGKTAIININGAQDSKTITDQVIAELRKQGFLEKAGKK